MLLDFISSNWVVQAILVAGIMINILFAVFRRGVAASEVRRYDREREQERIIEIKASASKAVTTINGEG